MASLREAVETALSLHRSGDAAAADRIYRQVLAVDPGLADVRYLLGMACLQQGQAAEAAEQIAAALRTRPEMAEWWANLAAAQRAAGHPEAALDALARAVELTPRNAEMLADYGAGLAASGRGEEAEAVLSRALSLAPAHRPAAGNLAALLANRAAADLAAHAPGPALERLDRAAALASLLTADLRGTVQHRRGRALLALDRLDASEAAFRAAAADRPTDPAPLIDLGDLLNVLGRFGEAEAVLRRALDLSPGDGGALNNLGNALHGAGRLDDAVQAYRAVPPDSSAAFAARVNLGTVHRDLGDDAGAEDLYVRALAERPDDPDLHWQRALARLLAGDLETGWAEYEWRWRTRQFRRPAELSGLPDWTKGSPPARLLLFAEQGHGDTLQFVRYAPLLLARGVRLGLWVQPALVRLMRASFGQDVEVQPLGAPVHAGRWDAVCPLMGLPNRFGTTLPSIPADVPYLMPEPGDAARWRGRVQALPGLKVGLVWAGDPRRGDPRAAAVDRRRSMTPAALAPLAAAPGVTFLSLQKGDAAAADRPFHLIDWTAELKDFAETAALVSSLDLVIGVDTAVVHLAGALGRPTWVLSRLDGCWRWLRDRNDSPWYPQTRLYRQTRWGDWTDPVAHAAADLRRLADAHRS